jgi:DNA/RNA-binding domain of Phe-tRNA-synthetase-like protein
MNKYYSHPEINEAKIPSIAISIILSGNRKIDTFEQFVTQELESRLTKYSSTAPKEVDTIIGFNELHRQHGKKSNRIASAPEALIKLMSKRGSIPRISPFIDIYNLISIKYALGRVSKLNKRK